MKKKIQTLNRVNFDCAVEIVCHLKDNKTMTEQLFEEYYEKETGKCGFGNSTNWKSIKQFLFDHKVMTTQKINGLRLYIATQKCVRTKIENMFNVYEVCSNLNIDQAVNWQKQNNGLIPIAMEARVIGKNFLGFSGKFLEQFIEMTTQIQSYHTEANINMGPCSMRFERKMSFLFALRELKVKKIN